MDNIILLIETATDSCSVALSKGTEIIAEKYINQPKAHASTLAVYIDDILKENSLTIHDCAAVAVSKGPGSYTGLRVGVSCAKGLCYGAGKPLISVCTLATIAQLAIDEGMCSSNEPYSIVPMIDARRMEVYTAMYDATTLDPTSEVIAKVIDEQSFAEELSEETIYFFGNGAEKCQSVITSPNAMFVPDIVPQAKYMGQLAEKAAALDVKQMAYYEPFYLKEFVPAPGHVKGLK